MKKEPFWKEAKYRRLTDVLIATGIFLLATLISLPFFWYMRENHVNIALIYMLAVVLIARYTNGYALGILSSVGAVCCINFFFTYPFFAMDFTLAGYPVVFVCMLATSIATSVSTTHAKKLRKMLSQREKQLLEAEKEKMRANLLRAVSHDLRTPLTSIMGASSSYLENTETLSEEEKRELVQNIYKDSDWLLHMVENLLSVTRINEGSTKVNKSMEMMEEVISEAVLKVRKRIPQARIEVKIPEEILMVPMDPLLIEQVIINLLENALTHSRTTLPVKCSLREKDNMACCSIRDYGVGIPEDRLESIFDGCLYGEESASSDGKKGMGIGLSICKTIINAHGGQIGVTVHQQGVEFWFCLPKETEE